MAVASRTFDLFGEDELPQGFSYQAEFVGSEEERSLLRDIVVLPFKEFEFHGFTGKRRTVSFGWRYDFKGGGLSKTENMPEFLAGLRVRAEAFAGSAPGSFQQVLVTEYSPGPEHRCDTGVPGAGRWAGAHVVPPSQNLPTAKRHSLDRRRGCCSNTHLSQ